MQLKITAEQKEGALWGFFEAHGQKYGRGFVLADDLTGQDVGQGWGYLCQQLQKDARDVA